MGPLPIRSTAPARARGARRPSIAPALLLVGQPWDWLGPLIDALRALPGNAALFLIVGGLSILSLIVFLVVLQSFIPTRAAVPSLVDDRPVDRQLRGIRPRANLPRPFGGGTLDTGRLEARSARAVDLDSVLDQAVLRGIGEPRLLFVDDTVVRLRMYGCGSCEPSFARQRQGMPLECLHERGFLEGAFARIRGSPAVEERSCRLRGAPYCEFEVRQ
ncbi:MAG TPA: hypothetical protein VI818_06075 [Candidatus Thermoplasmatota archaeon]|nr:hypothetical protein [Candidatus Thermoplasmatota archaeon]